ncbi:MAG: beta-N-acetylhexosaminidase [Alphaproteobacteria bacterium]|nr:beta-N-acetylhexosaminidase [Alphaproteobacteria bacterium]
MPLPAIFGFLGPTLAPEERELFRATDPLGFILFGRNIVDPEQVRTLVSDLRVAVGRADAPVLIDQEGGRVARLKPPHWRAAPPAGRIGAIAAQRGLEHACEAARLNSRLLADDLSSLGIDVDCAPVADVPIPEAHEIIGDRAYSSDAFLVGKIARAAAEGLLEGGVLPVIKHIPGHGRALADSHEDLPVVEDRREALDGSDFAPFRALADMPWAMTAHVVYTAIDAEHPATTSPRVISEIIRSHIGFKGVLVSDDLSMNALDGDLASRARAAIGAGCDLALHCTGIYDEIREVAEALTPINDELAGRLFQARSMALKPAPFDRKAATARLRELLGEGP